LLLSLSEHIGFCAGLCGSDRRLRGADQLLSDLRFGEHSLGLGFGALLRRVFGILYVLISLEDYALLAGSLTLFGFLALAMVLTRKVDWYQLSEGLNVRRGRSVRIGRYWMRQESVGG